MVNCPLDVAIGELLRSADPLSKTVLSTYRHDKDHSVNLAAISSSKFKNEVLERCAEFLNLSTRTAGGDKIFKNKSQMADKIILKIESYFENTCDECNQAYQHHITDEETPKIACILCLQGAHNCDPMNQKLDPLLALSDSFPKGMVWICKGCREKNDTRPHTCSTNAPDNRNKAAKDTGNQKSDDDKQKDDGDDEPFQSPRRDRLTIGRTYDLDICPLYKKAKCPHGITGKRVIEGKACPKSHPKRCIQYCRYGTNKKGGCTKGTSCSYYHPILCRHALVNKRCTREGCTFTHPKGTVRHEENDPSRNNSQHNNTSETRKRLQYERATNCAASRDSKSKGETSTNMDESAKQPEILNASFLEKMINDLMDKKMRQMESHFMPYMRQMSMQYPPLMPMTQMPLLDRTNMFPQHSPA